MNCKVPKFDGETSWELYRKQFEAAVVANGWTEHQKATELVLALRVKALVILQNIPQCKQGDYYSLANALELRYGNKYLTQVYQSQLKSRAQGSSETLQEFGAEIERLIRLAYPQAPEDFLNQIAVQNFTDGARGADLQQALRLFGRFRNLTDAVVYSLEFEVAKNISYKKERVREVKFSDDQYQTMNLIVKKLDQILQNGDNNRK